MTKKVCILQEFINKRVDNYVEPQRRGTPKGEPIGFSLVKYRAALYMLSNHKVKDIAKNLNISVGLLRKWKTEQAFENLIGEHINDFIDFYSARINLKINEQEKLNNVFYNQPFEKITDSPPEVDINEFDEEGYSPRLRDFIDDRLIWLIHTGNEKLIFFIFGRLLPLHRECWSRERGGKPQEDVEIVRGKDNKLNDEIFKNIINMFRDIFSKPDDKTDRYKKECLVALILFDKALFKK